MLTILVFEIKEEKNVQKIKKIILLSLLKAMLHGAIFLATCNAILLLRDVN
jgi:hypothetical protein